MLHNSFSVDPRLIFTSSEFMVHTMFQDGTWEGDRVQCTDIQTSVVFFPLAPAPVNTYIFVCESDKKIIYPSVVTLLERQFIYLKFHTGRYNKLGIRHFKVGIKHIVLP